MHKNQLKCIYHKIKGVKKMTLQYFYDWLKDNGIFTQAELELITHMNGYNIDTLNLAVYSRCGYQTVQDLINDSKQEN
jgi:hypothetical protein